MQKRLGQLVYSPSDLIRFTESPYSSWMDRYHLEFPGRITPDDASEELQLVAATGDQHEKKFLGELESRGPVHKITRRDTAVEETRAALAAGHATIYQACLEKTPFCGFADFLHRYGTGPAGQALYEVWDTKLARSTKPYYLIQLCCYGEMLAELQGVLPPRMRVALGSGEIPEYVTSEFYYYYLELKAAFLALMAQFDPAKPPTPGPRADHGRWASHAERWLEAQDHLVLVANINQSQITKLNRAGITTVAKLALWNGEPVPKLNREVLDRLAEQARLQVETRAKRAQAGAGVVVPPAYRVLSPTAEAPHHGLALLPPPSPHDVFFDMEGYPLIDGGLEYLFGASTRKKDGTLEFHDWWAHDEAGEKAAFEGFIDWVHERWKSEPNLHIYHYASYEVTAMRKLMGKHGTREDEVDDLLRNDVFVDLYAVVRQGLRVGESSYSIKSIEHLYRGKRSGDVASAGQSMVYYAHWMESGEPADWEKSGILRKIRDYNQDDCESTVQLYDWLAARQREAGLHFNPRPKTTPTEKPVDEERAAFLAEQERLAAALEQKAGTTTDVETKRLHALFSHLLDFHRREKKPEWWRRFERMAAEPAELKEDLDCIGDARLVSTPPRQEKRSKIFSYEFDPDQDTKITKGQRVLSTASLAASFEIVELDADRGLIEIKIGDTKLGAAFPEGLPPRTSFMPGDLISDGVLREAVLAVIRGWVDQEAAPSCLLDFLRRQPPRLRCGGLQAKDEPAGKAAVRIVQQLDGSALCLQGPPGTGKTTTAAHMIVTLLAAGKRVGLMSNSHKAVENLLLAVCGQSPALFPMIKVGGESAIAAGDRRIRHVASSGDAHPAYSGGMIAGTAWLFARPEWSGELDCLFIDEAGQVSLANLVAVSRVARNLVVLGDQMQLEQPTQGSHPGESGLSILHYYLQHHATIPASLGLFLPTTYRLHPEICRYVSEMIYDSRLEPAPATAHRRLLPKQRGDTLGLPEAGLLFVPVEHEGNVQASDEEADQIVTLVHNLVGRTLTGIPQEPDRAVALADILIVAPYNMQVRKLQQRLPDARVGSVDKFQGQEAEVVIVSMCSSFGEYGSRGLEFILDANRLNVAISRARTLAIVVGDPRIAKQAASNIPSMHRLNLYCRLTQGRRLTR